MGKAMALGLAEAGAAVVVAARTASRVEATAAEIGGLGVQSAGIAVDLSSPEACQGLVQQVVDRFGKLDILVNCAGIIDRTPAENVTAENWRKVMAVNLDATFYCSQAAGRVMLEAGRGKIINVASASSFVGLPNRLAYATSKGGVVQFTRSLAAEWSSRGIQVNAIAPGWFRTEINAVRFDDEGWRSRIVDRVAAGRTGVPEDLKGVTIFLASPASDYVTGQVILVDGGYVFSDTVQ